MIGHLRGTVLEMLPTQLLLEVGGVGYEVLVPLSTSGRIDSGGEVTLYTHLAVREDAHVLYGFASRQERDLFRILITSVTGIGPKIALNILGAMPVARFEQAVSLEDAAALSSIPGIGKKTAERIIVELRDKVGLGAASRPSGLVAGGGVGGDHVPLDPVDEAVRALIALQIRPADAASMVDKARRKLGTVASTEELVRACLQKS
jgi:Holliday junction DNA helicase RuvA